MSESMLRLVIALLLSLIAGLATCLVMHLPPWMAAVSVVSTLNAKVMSVLLRKEDDEDDAEMES